MTDLQGAIDAINPNSTDEEWTRLLAEAMNAADEIAALRARVAVLEAQLLANKEADLDRHIFAWFNDHDCDEMRRCLETYDARQGRAILSKQEPEYSGWVEVVDEGGSP